MPCYDGRRHDDENIMMRLACIYCSELEQSHQPIPTWTKYWWKDHVNWDRKHG